MFLGRIVAARDLRIGRPVAVKELLGKTTAMALEPVVDVLEKLGALAEAARSG